MRGWTNENGQTNVVTLGTSTSPTSSASLARALSECEFPCIQLLSKPGAENRKRVESTSPFRSAETDLKPTTRPTNVSRRRTRCDSGLGTQKPAIGAGTHLPSAALTQWNSGSRLAMYGAPAIVGVLMFASGIPRVQRDVLQVWQP